MFEKDAAEVERPAPKRAEAAAPDLYSATVSALTAAGFGFQEYADAQFLRAPFAGKAVSYEITVFCGPSFITMVGELPLSVGEEHLTEALQSLNEQNTKLPLGNFQLSEQFQRVQFRISLPARRIPLDDEIETCFRMATVFIQKVVPNALKWVSVGTETTLDQMMTIARGTSEAA